MIKPTVGLVLLRGKIIAFLRLECKLHIIIAYTYRPMCTVYQTRIAF